uniref:SHSP domain-containing protein n=1 Tax=Panagrellus redivivus TaxID=6233 RepID=A0A7E4ZWE7_PANRE
MALFIYPHQHGAAPARRSQHNHQPSQYADFDNILTSLLGLDQSNHPSQALQTAPPAFPRFQLDPNGTFKAAVTTRDFNPSELKVEVDGRDLVVSGEHASSDEHGGSIQRSFVSRLRIPEGVDLETIKADYDDVNHALKFIGHVPQKNPNLTSIPITFKTTTDTPKAAPAAEKKQVESNGDAWVE